MYPRVALDGNPFFWHGIITSESPPKKRCSSSPAAPARKTSPQTNARHDPKNGQERRRPREPSKTKVLFCLDLVSTTLEQYGAANSLQKLLRTKRMDSSPQSRRTEEVARWRWSPRLWRLHRWELSHQRLMMSASPRTGDTTRMRLDGYR